MMLNHPLKSAAAKAVLLAAALAASHAQASPVGLTLVNAQSVGHLDNPANTTLDLDVGAFTSVVRLGFDVTLTAFDPSWISEMSVKITNTSGTGGLYLTPANRPPDVFGSDYQYAGDASFTFELDLDALGLTFSAEADGLLHVQFFEDPIDDLPGADGVWNGRLIVNPMPEPASFALLALGLGLAGFGSRGQQSARQSKSDFSNTFGRTA